MNKKYLRNTFLVGTSLSFLSAATLADVSLSGSTQFHYVNQDPGSSTSGASNDYFDSESVVDFIFTNKLDSVWQSKWIKHLKVEIKTPQVHLVVMVLTYLFRVDLVQLL